MANQIINAFVSHFPIVKQITHETISAIYPHYYPMGVVDFFLAHHSDEHIMEDIRAGVVYLLMHDNGPVGTVTIKGNEINRLFVLPQHQRKGFGRQLLDFAEEMIFMSHSTICLSSSLPAKRTYLNRGYIPLEAHQIVTENGDVLCYDWMQKTAAP